MTSDLKWAYQVQPDGSLRITVPGAEPVLLTADDVRRIPMEHLEQDEELEGDEHVLPMVLALYALQAKGMHYELLESEIARDIDHMHAFFTELGVILMGMRAAQQMFSDGTLEAEAKAYLKEQQEAETPKKTFAERVPSDPVKPETLKDRKRGGRLLH